MIHTGVVNKSLPSAARAMKEVRLSESLIHRLNNLVEGGTLVSIEFWNALICTLPLDITVVVELLGNKRIVYLGIPVLDWKWHNRPVMQRSPTFFEKFVEEKQSIIIYIIIDWIPAHGLQTPWEVITNLLTKLVPQAMWARGLAEEQKSCKELAKSRPSLHQACF